MDIIKKTYKGTENYNDIYIVPVIDNVMASIKTDGSDATSWDTKGKTYTDRLVRIVLNVEAHPHTKEDKLLLILQQFRDSFLGGAAGLEESDDAIPIEPYNGKTDPLWNELKEQYNVNTERQLKIITYGTAFRHEAPKKCQCIFNAAIMRGNTIKRSPLQKKLVKLRGTDYRLQQDIRNAELFPKFINSTVKQIEKDDLHFVAIICRAGHHRSVASAEMLVHLYPNV